MYRKIAAFLMCVQLITIPAYCDPPTTAPAAALPSGATAATPTAEPQVNTPPDIQVPPGSMLIPERTEVRVELEQDLRSGGDKVGEEVDYKVLDDVYDANHALLIPAGTPAYGRVTKSSRRGMFGKPGKLEFTCDYVFLNNSQHVALRSDPMGKSGHGNVGAVVATALFLSVLGVFINGRDVLIKRGTDFPMYVDAPTIIPKPVDASAGSSSVSLFTLKDGEQFTGQISSFDGTTYIVTTGAGPRQVAGADVKSIYAVK